MTVAGFRHKRIAGEIEQEIGIMLAGELKDPRLAGAVVVTEVRLSPDMRQARVYVAVAGDETEKASILDGLTAAAGYIRHELIDRLRLRRALDVTFVIDRSQEHGQRIDDLLRDTKNPG